MNTRALTCTTSLPFSDTQAASNGKEGNGNNNNTVTGQAQLMKLDAISLYKVIMVALPVLLNVSKKNNLKTPHKNQQQHKR